MRLVTDAKIITQKRNYEFAGVAAANTIEIYRLKSYFIFIASHKDLAGGKIKNSYLLGLFFLFKSVVMV